MYKVHISGQFVPLRPPNLEICFIRYIRLNEGCLLPQSPDWIEYNFARILAEKAGLQSVETNDIINVLWRLLTPANETESMVKIPNTLLIFVLITVTRFQKVIAACLISIYMNLLYIVWALAGEWLISQHGKSQHNTWHHIKPCMWYLWYCLLNVNLQFSSSDDE